jgi:hypothetical protein
MILGATFPQADSGQGEYDSEIVLTES